MRKPVESGGRMTEGTSPAAIAVTVTEMARDGRFEEAEGLFAPALRAVVSAEALRAGWRSWPAQGAAARARRPGRRAGRAGLVRVRVPVTFEHGGLTVVMSVDDAGLLQGLRIEPAAAASWAPPAYAVPDRFAEREVRSVPARWPCPGR